MFCMFDVFIYEKQGESGFRFFSRKFIIQNSLSINDQNAIRNTFYLSSISSGFSFLWYLYNTWNLRLLFEKLSFRQTVVIHQSIKIFQICYSFMDTGRSTPFFLLTLIWGMCFRVFLKPIQFQLFSNCLSI